MSPVATLKKDIWFCKIEVPLRLSASVACRADIQTMKRICQLLRFPWVKKKEKEILKEFLIEILGYSILVRPECHMWKGNTF